ncbi:MAG: hypothetical protein HC843_02370 [Sphingomonadales bacterium]|nr:hypothetical protein [Sphingomonadales bacterium]
MLHAGKSEMTLSLMMCDPANGNAKRIEIPVKKDTGRGEHKADETSQPCAYAGISHAAIDRTDPVLLAAALAFAALMGLLLPLKLSAAQAIYYHPPARAPPLA